MKITDPRPADDRMDDGPLWRNFSFTLMWTSTAASGFGDRMMMYAGLGLLGGVAATADSTSINASISFWFFLPYILLSIPAGYLADRVSRKWLMLTCDELRGALLLLAWYLLASTEGPAAIPDDHYWKVWAILFCVGACAATFNPTRNAIVPQLVSRSHLAPANAVILGINVVAAMIGMIAGPMIVGAADGGKVEMEGVRTGLFIGAGLFIISGLFFAFLRRHRHAAPPAEEQGGDDLIHGLMYIVHHRRVRQLVMLDVIVWGAAAVVYSSILGLGKERFGVIQSDLMDHMGLVGGAVGVGLLLGAGLMAAIRTRKESSMVLSFACFMTGVSVLVFTVAPWLWLHVAAAVAVGTFGNMAIVGVLSMIQSITPNYVRGRVMGLNNVANTLFSVLVYLAIWQLPNADVNIIYVLYGLVPVLLLTAYRIHRHNLKGPMPTWAHNWLWRFVRLYGFVWHRLDVVGKHHVPSEGPVLLCANHTTGLDPFVIQPHVQRVVRWVMMTSYTFSVLNWFWKLIRPISLDLNGSDMAQIRQIVGELKKDEVVGIFPEGALQRTERMLKPFEHGFAMVAKRGGATIVPVWIHGTPKANHMFWHFAMPSDTTVLFGPPFTPGRKQDNEEIVQELLSRMVDLARQVDPDIKVQWTRDEDLAEGEEPVQYRVEDVPVDAEGKSTDPDKS